MNLDEFCKRHGYTLSKTIPDNWDRYGTGIPSVTTILSLIEDNGLQQVLKYNSSAIKSSINEGIKTHKEAELFFKKKSGIIKCNLNVTKFHSYYNVSIVSTEKTYEEDICGTVDLVAIINGEYYNVDYKQSKYHSPKYFLQLMGYKYLNGYNGKLVYLKGKLQVMDVPNEYYPIFLELKDYFFKLKRGGKKKP